MRKYLTLLWAIGLLTSCSTTNIKQNSDDTLGFNSNDWLLERFKKYRANPLNIEVRVTPKDNNSFLVNMDFKGDPQDPLRGINPTAVSIFSFCINSHVTNRKGHTAWIFGMRKDGNTERKRSYLLMVGDYHTLESIEKDTTLQWSKPVRIVQNAKSCKGLIKSEYLW